MEEGGCGGGGGWEGREGSVGVSLMCDEMDAVRFLFVFYCCCSALL